MALNINHDIRDMYYRYKMPILRTKLEGGGNGVKTVLVNIKEISKALSRPPQYLIKYLSISMGAQIHMDKKQGIYSINGAHEANILQSTLRGFITTLVVCKECSNPETELRVRHRKLHMRCKACGDDKRLAHINEKISQYIIKSEGYIIHFMTCIIFQILFLFSISIMDITDLLIKCSVALGLFATFNIINNFYHKYQNSTKQVKSDSKDQSTLIIPSSNQFPCHCRRCLRKLKNNVLRLRTTSI